MKGLLTSLITILTFTGLQAQTLPAAPKLVIGLTIDQLRSDYMEAFSTLYGEKGFKRLKREGTVYTNAEYTFANPDRASAVAAIYTGTTPSLNGIVGNRWLDVATLQPTNCVEDAAFMGYYTLETASAAKLLTSTIADELKIATQGKGLVYSIAPYRDAAIFGAGHAGDGAFWLNELTGKWCGTTYYNEFPLWLTNYNDRKGIDFRIANITWEPLLSPQLYTNGTENGKAEFKHKFDETGRSKFRRLAMSPIINDEINLVLEDLFAYSSVGFDQTPDLLSVTYYAGNYNNQFNPQSYAEIQDTYIRLDRSIEKLLDIVDKSIGLQNTLIFITSTGYTDPENADAEYYRIPTGDFYINRCAALLNMFLMATYGEGQYVDAYHNQQIFLNHRLIEERQLDMNELLSKASDFLIQFSGVNEVYSSHRLLLGAWTPEIHRIRNAYHRKRSGDLVIDVLPGWKIIDENTYEIKVVRHGHISKPLFFIGYSVKPAVINTPVTVDHIAPTLAHFMRIRAPNACTTTPLVDIR